MIKIITAILAALALILLIVVLLRSAGKGNRRNKPKGCKPAGIESVKRAGMAGEQIASDQIRKVLRKDDRLLTNVHVSYDGKYTELDNVVINRYGIFIIEVKSYKGRLYGHEEDFEWEKFKDDGYGNTFEKRVKNPIRQVKRQVFILAKRLHSYGIDAWVEGYALLVQGKSPVDSPVVLTSLKEIDRAIHTSRRRYLSVKTIEAAERLLEKG